MIAALIQSVTGLFMTDDIFFEGPLHDYIDEGTFDWVYLLHHNAWRVVVGAVAVHLFAHVVYGVVLRDSTPLSMITGQKHVALPPVSTPWIRALFSFAAGVAAFAVLAYLAD
jgi:cytochrome b